MKAHFLSSSYISWCKGPCLQVTDSIYDLVGAEVPAKVKVQNLERVFGSMDSDKDGVISLEEFTVYCSTNTHVLDSLAVLP